MSVSSVPSGGAGANPDELGNEYIRGMMREFNKVSVPEGAFTQPVLLQRLYALNPANTTAISPAQLETLQSLLRELHAANVRLGLHKNRVYETDFFRAYQTALDSKSNNAGLDYKIKAIAVIATQIYHYELLIGVADVILAHKNAIEAPGSFVAKQQLLQDAIRSLQTSADPPAGCLGCSKRASAFPTALNTIPPMKQDLYENLKESIRTKKDIATGKRLMQELMQKTLKSRLERITAIGGKRRNRTSKKTKRSKKLRTRRHR